MPQSTAPHAVRPDDTTQPAKPRYSSVQILLLILGVSLVTIAVLAFASVAYDMLGDIGRALCIGVVGLVALAAGALLARWLRVTAEGLTWAGLAALTIDAILIGRMPIVMIRVPSGFASGILVLLLTFIALALRRIPIPERPAGTAEASEGGTHATPPNGSPSASSSSHTPATRPGHPGTPNQTTPAATPAKPHGIPLRAYSLYATFSLPCAMALLMTDLPLWDSGVRNTLAAAAAALVAAIAAAVIHTDRRSRTSDFEWLASLITAMLLLTPLSFSMFGTASDGEPFAVAAAICGIIPVIWALAFIAAHRRVSWGNGRPVTALLRVPPTVGFFWTCTAISVPLHRALDPTSSGDAVARMAAYLPSVAVGAVAISLGCLLPRSGRCTAISPAERTAASGIGSFVLAVISVSEFSRDDFPSLVTAMAAFVVMLTVCVIAELRAANPLPAQPAPSAPTAQSMPAMSTAPQQPERQARGLDWPVILATWITGSVAVILVLWSWAVSRPYAPADLIAMLIGAATLIVGVHRLAVNPRLRSWPALWLPLTLLMAPPLLMSWYEPPSFPRMLALFAIALCTVLIGALRGLQAPLLYGTVVLVAHVLTVIWPWLAEFSRQYWWVWLLIGGVLLIVVAARYEASLKSLRTFGVRISELR
ncbi:SCO7613 C-terminal domain-containing membrane protein [Bifidobacterium myosotis]|uniref:Uncharacterized protein n=1 Tax=Bifidobacterium myosotis TaxID=1630166 RepID=A0A5M9ZQB7_9BIFI|nr:hypothetical protein [Bifidobacterium myosotis]KAA8829639.1 hypothetical protein EMO91_01200 [Bifidobacterium myosotis]